MFELPFSVDYADTDAMGIMHHGSYCRYLERARVRWLDSLQMSYAELEKEGFALPLRSLKIEYLKPLRFDDKACVKLWISHMGRARVVIDYEIHDKDKQTLLSRAQTEHVLVKNMKTVSIPEEWRNKWQQQSAPKS